MVYYVLYSSTRQLLVSTYIFHQVMSPLGRLLLITIFRWVYGAFIPVNHHICYCTICIQLPIPTIAGGCTVCADSACPDTLSCRSPTDAKIVGEASSERGPKGLLLNCWLLSISLLTLNHECLRRIQCLFLSKVYSTRADRVEQISLVRNRYC
jgi:hypothetical protein